MDRIRESSSRSVKPSSSIPVSANRQPYPPPFRAKMFGPTKRAIGTMLHAAPALVNHGTNFLCSVFARVIVARLSKAEAPELEHLGMFADDEPRCAHHHGKTEDRQHTKPNEENRHRHKSDRHPCR